MPYAGPTSPVLHDRGASCWSAKVVSKTFEAGTLIEPLRCMGRCPMTVLIGKLRRTGHDGARILRSRPLQLGLHFVGIYSIGKSTNRDNARFFCRADGIILSEFFPDSGEFVARTLSRPVGGVSLDRRSTSGLSGGRAFYRMPRRQRAVDIGGSREAGGGRSVECPANSIAELAEPCENHSDLVLC